MTVGWQDAVVVGLLVAAAIYLAQRLRRLGRRERSAGCGTCLTRPEPAETAQLISIDPPAKAPYGDNTTA